MHGDAERIHVTGGPGSGKTRFAQRLAAMRSMPLHDLDGLLLAVGDRVDRLEADGTALKLAGLEAWVSDGVYFGWARPFIERADIVVWLDVPWRVASFRIVTRHLRLELTRKNRFPGWRRFYSFWRWSARYYANRNEATLDRLGVPNTRSVVASELAPYGAKLVVCRTTAEVANTFARLSLTRT
jgi:adenylate kinase family enzyme